jgi:hypothetical protein
MNDDVLYFCGLPSFKITKENREECQVVSISNLVSGDSSGGAGARFVIQFSNFGCFRGSRG